MGPLALRLAVVAGVVAAVCGAWPRRPPLRRWAAPAAAVATVATVVALLVLARAFWDGDFSLVYVADHSRRAVDRVTRLSGIWGGMGGSLLFFAVGTGIAGVVAAWRAPAADRPTVAAVGAAWATALVVLVVWLSDPFRHLQVPATDGAGLTPILEHPAMRYHPPLLYAGLTSLAAPFALTIAALVDRRLDDAWLGQVRRWLLVPWTLLAVGMVAGAHWAYVELGWGGFWAWDPVENTALLPWLAITAALHGLQRPTVPDNGDGDGHDDATAVSPPTVAALVGGAFALSILGALLTRSGATSSVHAFAEASAIGRAFAVLLATVVVGVAALLWHARRRGGRPRRLSLAATRANALAGHQLVVLAVLAIVLVGSLWPLLADLRGGRGVAVEGWFFAAFCGPLAVHGLALMAVGPLLGRRSLRPVAAGATVGLLGALLAGWSGGFALTAAAAGGAAITGALVGLGSARTAAHGAHLGMAILLVGVAGTTTGTTEDHRVPRDGTVTVQGHTVTNRGVEVLDDATDRTTAVVATIDVDGHTLHPELVAHLDRDVLLAESALWSTPWRDVQLMLRDADDDGTVMLQVGVHPLQQWVWWGALLVVGAGAWAFASRPVAAGATAALRVEERAQ
jgi:cytochrome c-type biogenesis protein CcmF